jgi:uncharacterized membrane protein YgcG
MNGDDFGDNNVLTDMIVRTLDPAIVYENMTYVATVGAIIPWLIVLFGAIRLAQEASAGLSGKAALAEAMGDASKTLLMIIAYSGGGLLIFALIFVLADLFNNFGSTRLINREMLEMRAILMADPEAQKAWYERVVMGMVDVANAPLAGLMWLIWQFLSVAYIALARLIDVMFAIGVALTYAWGFIAIPTRAMKDEFNLMPGLSKTILTLAIWVILEPILLFFVWLLSRGAVEYFAATYSGNDIGTTAITIWYVFSCVLMFLVLLIRIISPFLALYLARNDSMVGALGAGPAAVGAMVANQVIRKLADHGSSNDPSGQSEGGRPGMMPSAEGTRTRDRMVQGIGDALHTPISQLFGGGGSNDLSSQIPGGGSGGSDGSGNDNSGFTASGASTQSGSSSGGAGTPSAEPASGERSAPDVAQAMSDFHQASQAGESPDVSGADNNRNDLSSAPPSDPPPDSPGGRS